MRGAIDWLRQHRVDVILVGLQFVDARLRDAYYIAVRDGLRSMAAHENVIMLRRDEAVQLIAQAKTGQAETLSEDVEFNETTYTCLAPCIARAITLGLFAKPLLKEPDKPR